MAPHPIPSDTPRPAETPRRAIADAGAAAPTGARVPSKLGTLGRCLIAAVAMLLCSLMPALTTLIPGFAPWAEPSDPDLLWTLAELARMSLPVLAALLLLTLAARIEVVPPSRARTAG